MEAVIEFVFNVLMHVFDSMNFNWRQWGTDAYRFEYRECSNFDKVCNAGAAREWLNGLVRDDVYFMPNDGAASVR